MTPKIEKLKTELEHREGVYLSAIDKDLVDTWKNHPVTKALMSNIERQYLEITLDEPRVIEDAARNYALKEALQKVLEFGDDIGSDE